MLVFEVTLVEMEYTRPGDERASTISAGFQELRWYHYFGRTGRSLFTCAGIGLVDFLLPRSAFDGTGLNYVVGGGVEILKEISVGIYYHGGYVENDGHRHGVRLLQLVATVIAY